MGAEASAHASCAAETGHRRSTCARGCFHVVMLRCSAAADRWKSGFNERRCCVKRIQGGEGVGVSGLRLGHEALGKGVERESAPQWGLGERGKPGA